ncbi:MAG: hypothetical protein KAS62_02305 [Candidatus Delongbacteria bacterium]|nr:hypothetical protein [Candidatus Delongbacteria bacterium]
MRKSMINIVIFFVLSNVFCQDKTSELKYISSTDILNTEDDYSNTKCKQSVHQLLTKEGFNLLKSALNNRAELTEMESYIGDNETMPSTGVMSIGDGTIVSGAWVEDEYDIVYWYGMMDNIPSGSYDPMWLFNVGT